MRQGRRVFSHQAAKSAARTPNGRLEVFKQDQPVEFASKDWGTTDVVYRILPAFNPEVPGQWDQLILSQDRSQLGEWIRFYPMSRGLGDPLHSEDAVQFILKEPDSNQSEDAFPSQVLYNTVDRACKAGTDPGGWARLLKFDGKLRRAPLSKCEACGFMRVATVRGSVYDPAAQKSKIQDMQPWKGLGPEDMMQVLLLPGATGKKVQDMIIDYFVKTGIDPVAIGQGAFLRMWQAEMGDPRKLVTFPASGTARRGWDVHIMDVYEGQSPELSQYEQLLRTKLLPSWDDIIKIPTIEEQARLLAARFDPKLIVFAFADYPEWIPEDVRAKAAARVQQAVPQGYGGGYAQPPAGYGQPPMGYQGMPQQGFPPAQPGFGDPQQMQQMQQPQQPQQPWMPPQTSAPQQPWMQQQTTAAPGMPLQQPAPGYPFPPSEIPPAGVYTPPQQPQPGVIGMPPQVTQSPMQSVPPAVGGGIPAGLAAPPFDPNMQHGQAPQPAPGNMQQFAAPPSGGPATGFTPATHQPAAVDQQMFANAPVMQGYDPQAAAAAGAITGMPPAQPMPMAQPPGAPPVGNVPARLQGAMQAAAAQAPQPQQGGVPAGMQFMSPPQQQPQQSAG